jgi:hypothetical protein
MSSLKFIAIVVVTVIASVMAIKLLVFLLKLVGIVVNLVWLAIVVGFFLAVAWVIYKLFKPRDALS